jgi:hypothetical protein
MKHRKTTWMLLMVLLAAVASNAALARGHGHGRGGSHARIGVFIGAPIYSYGYYPAPYYPAPYYYPSVPVVPPVYVEQGSPEAAPEPANYWYYCADAKAYYPYVKQCPGGWQRVAPSPPPG